MVTHVLEFGRYIKERIEAIGPVHSVNEWTETKVGLYSVDPALWGTADKIIFEKGNILIVDDFKYGKGKRVSAVENPQLGIYILAALEEIGATFDTFPVIEGVISQPRNGGTSSWFPTREWLTSFKEKVRAAIALTRTPDAPLKAGSWCTFCKAKSFCPENEKTIAEEANVDFSIAPIPGAADIMAPATEPWKVARMLDYQDLIESRLSANRVLAQQMLESGREVPGYKLVDGRASRKWFDENVAALKYEPLHGDKVYAPRKVKSVAQMEALVGKKNLDATLYETVPGHKKVAADNDPRPSTISTAQADFGAVTPRDSFLGEFSAPRVVEAVVVEPARREPLWPV